MNKAVIGVVVALVVIVLGIFLVIGGNDSTEHEDDSMMRETTGSVTAPAPAAAIDQGDEDVTFVLAGENFKFVMNGEDNPTLRVNEGDLVRVEFTSTKGFHDFVVDEFDAATPKIRDTDVPTYVEFVADKAGTYEYYCSVGEHRANGMKGTLIVS